MRRATLAAALLLASLAIPAAFAVSVEATPDCVLLVVNTVGVVCKGTYWCDSGGICAQEYCTVTIGPKEYACVLSPP